MKKTVLSLMILVATSQAFAGQKDLKIFNALVAGGVVTEGGMGKTWAGVNPLTCTYLKTTKEYICDSPVVNNMYTGEVQVFQLSGQSARLLFNALIKAGAKIEVDKKANEASVTGDIQCSQTNEGMYDEPHTPAQLTRCEISKET
jgi:hypothetical protein